MRALASPALKGSPKSGWVERAFASPSTWREREGRRVRRSRHPYDDARREREHGGRRDDDDTHPTWTERDDLAAGLRVCLTDRPRDDDAMLRLGERSRAPCG